MALGMVVQAVKGAAEDVSAAPTVFQKAQRAFSLSATMVRELTGLLSGLPYAYYASALWKSPEKYQERWHFNLVKDVKYGSAERNLLDLYLPASCEAQSALPVLLFIHGGVWASGDKSLFSPIGATLAHNGVVAVLVQYTLFPQVLAEEQVKDVSRALTWTMDNVSQYGGNPERIHVMGHSAGGHLCGMLLWERAFRNLKLLKNSFTDSTDRRYPRSFLSLSGVFNIGEHYKYEQGRGVASLSCMKRAMGGTKGFARMSPEILFESILGLKSLMPVSNWDDDALVDELSNVDGDNMDWTQWASQLPPLIFFASDYDDVVPAITSIKCRDMLRTLGCKSAVALREELSHDDFACWVKGFTGTNNPKSRDLINDVLSILKNDRVLELYSK